MGLKRNLIWIAAATLLVFSFFLPNVAAGITDSRRLNNLAMIDSQSISFDSPPELSLPERLELVASSNTELLPLSTGNVMDVEAAGNRAILEFTRFFQGMNNLGVEGFYEFDFAGCVVEEGSAAIVIDPIAPALNMIVWELTLVDPSENIATITIDDETGIILRVVYLRSRRSVGQQLGANNLQTSNEWREDSWPSNWSEIEYRAAAQHLCDMMTEYYGFTVALADFYFSRLLAYYRADLTDDNPTIPMYGVVRQTSFTINERT
jgi:hypothetical protein